VSGLESDLWQVPLAEPVQPGLLDAVTGLDEQLLARYRRTPTWVLAIQLAPRLEEALEDPESRWWQPALHQAWGRLIGVTWWEREHEQIADTLGV
jgi:hypothetical protein